mgnify:CR=1 FL=1
MLHSAWVSLLHLSQRKAVQHCGTSIPAVRNSLSIEIIKHDSVYAQDLHVTWLVASQGVISRRGFIHWHMRFTRYVYMHVYVHVLYWNVLYRRLCTWNIGVSVSLQNRVSWHHYPWVLEVSVCKYWSVILLKMYPIVKRSWRAGEILPTNETIIAVLILGVIGLLPCFFDSLVRKVLWMYRWM